MNNDVENLKELIILPEFQKELLDFLSINNQEQQKLDIGIQTVSPEEDNCYTLFVSGLDHNYLITLKYQEGDYTFIEYEDVDHSIKNEKFNFDIDYWSYNITYDQLARLFEAKKIIIPKMQRGFVWDDMQASRLIESILMGLPLPSLFLIKNVEEGNYLVVDGLQRITTIHSFRYNKKLPNRPDTTAGFILKGDVNNDIVHKTYQQLLEEDKTDKFDMGTVNVIEFKQNKPDHEEAMYALFERLNSGGTNLSPQQIRNSISYGGFNNLLNEKADLIKDFFSKKAILSLAPSENLLRIVSIFDYIKDNNLLEVGGDNKGNITYKNLLNDTAQKYHMIYKVLERKNGDNQEQSNYREDDIALFDRISSHIDKCKEIFGEYVFSRYDFKKKTFLTRFTPVILESLVVTMLLNEGKTYKDKNDIIESYKNIFSEDSDFDTYFTQGTGRNQNIIGRVKSIQQVLYK